MAKKFFSHKIKLATCALCLASTSAAWTGASQTLNYENINVANSFFASANNVEDEATAFKFNLDELFDSLTEPDIDYNVVKPNEMGQIMIIMYHGLVNKKPHPNYQRTPADFKKDMQALYDKGYRLISLSDLINNDIKVKAGYTPVVLTFDDGMSSAFSLKMVDGELKPTPGCVVDILQKFSAEHPDFGNTALFAINGEEPDKMFRGDGTYAERLKYLIDNGYEIANHTLTHPHLGTISAEKIQKEIALNHKLISEALPKYNINCLVYPYGERPKKDIRGYAIKGEYGGIKYDYALALKEGQSGASATPGHVKFDPLNIPRVRGSEGARTDLWWSLDYFEKNPSERYISDGDPKRITVPKGNEGKINLEALQDKKVVFYEVVGQSKEAQAK